MDVSSNDNYNDVSSNDEIEGNDYDEVETSTVYIDNSIDYSNYFENLQTIGIFISGLLVAYGLAFAFFKGLNR